MAIRFEPIPPTPVNLAQAQAAIATLARAWTPGFADAIAATLRAETGDDATLDLDEALGLLEIVFRVLNEDGEANEAWPEPASAPLPLIPPQDLDLPPPSDDALERVLALLQTDANLCARLRAETGTAALSAENGEGGPSQGGRPFAVWTRTRTGGEPVNKDAYERVVAGMLRAHPAATREDVVEMLWLLGVR